MKRKPLLLVKKIRAATSELRTLGKTPLDAVALLRKFASPRTRRSESLALMAAGWSQSQVLAALEWAHLRALQRILDSPSPDLNAVVTLALEYADFPVNRVQREMRKMFADMLPDYERGKKVREKGQNAYGSWIDRCRQAEEFRRIDCELAKRTRATKRLRSVYARHRDIAEEYSARNPSKPVKYKTVERRLREFSIPLRLVEMALGRKLA